MNGLTPLHYAAELDQPEILELILSRCDTKIKDSAGYTADELASDRCKSILSTIFD